jgi:hypothetical protein
MRHKAQIRFEHEKVGATRKVRSIKHRRSRLPYDLSLTYDKRGKFRRHHELWKAVQKRNKPRPNYIKISDIVSVQAKVCTPKFARPEASCPYHNSIGGCDFPPKICCKYLEAAE